MNFHDSPHDFVMHLYEKKSISPCLNVFNYQTPFQVVHAALIKNTHTIFAQVKKYAGRLGVLNSRAGDGIGDALAIQTKQIDLQRNVK